jgi:hypothetical protein
MAAILLMAIFSHRAMLEVVCIDIIKLEDEQSILLRTSDQQRELHGDDRLQGASD